MNLFRGHEIFIYHKNGFHPESLLGGVCNMRISSHEGICRFDSVKLLWVSLIRPFIRSDVQCQNLKNVPNNVFRNILINKKKTVL